MTQSSQRAQALPPPQAIPVPGQEAGPPTKKEALRGMPFEAQVKALMPGAAPKDGAGPAPAGASKKEPGATPKGSAQSTGIVMSGGEQMIAVQKALAAKGFDPGPINGINAGRTKASIIEFQRKNGLVPDGIVGPKTLAALGVDVSGMKASPGIGQAPKKEEPNAKGEPPPDEKQVADDRQLWENQNLILSERAGTLRMFMAMVGSYKTQAGRDAAVGAMNHHRAFNAFYGAFTHNENKPKADFHQWYSVAFSTAKLAQEAYVKSIAVDGAAKQNETEEETW